MEASCSICGRTILAGERVHEYVEEGEARLVCELCIPGAERLGWPRADAETEQRQAIGHVGRGRLRRLWNRSPVPTPPLPDPAAPRRSRPTHPQDSDAPPPFERAVVRFNTSEAGRTVAGLRRTLGSPWVSIGASAGGHDEVRITVAWELSWYQWGVDIGDELRPVFEIDKGGELGQLDAAARQWNASLGEDGRLRLTREPASSR